MTTKTIAELVFRIWGVMLIARAAMSLPALLGLLAGQGETVEAGLLFGSRLSYIATILIQSALAVFVFVQAPLLAEWVARDDRRTTVNIDVPALYVVALSLFGVTLMVDGMQALGVTLYTWFSIRNEPVDTVSLVLERRWESIVRAAMQMLIGAALFVGRDAIVRGWRSLRGMDT
jgi:hypothetical protein